MTTVESLIEGARDGGSATLHDAVPRMYAERSRVEKLLSNGSQKVYGFNTLFGPLDGQSATNDDQRLLLDGHLLGRPIALPATLLRLLLQTKLHQLSQGGSGISGNTFEGILRALSDRKLPTCKADLTASYGSADVVPGAWICDFLVDSGYISLENPGDVIALISGNYCSTAAASATFIKFRNDMEVSLNLVDQASHLIKSCSTEDRQISVALRDITPLRRAVNHAVSCLKRAIEERLASQPANPQFRSSEVSMVAVSTSSFLDFKLTLALTTATQVLVLMAGYLQRSVEHLCLSMQHTSERDIASIQPPKVASAFLENLRAKSGHLATNFTGQDSENLEDARDLSLITTLNFSRMVHSYQPLVGLAAHTNERFIRSQSLHRYNKITLDTELCSTEIRDLVEFLACI